MWRNGEIHGFLDVKFGSCFGEVILLEEIQLEARGGPGGVVMGGETKLRQCTLGQK